MPIQHLPAKGNVTTRYSYDGAKGTNYVGVGTVRVTGYGDLVMNRTRHADGSGLTRLQAMFEDGTEVSMLLSDGELRELADLAFNLHYRLHNE